MMKTREDKVKKKVWETPSVLKLSIKYTNGASPTIGNEQLGYQPTAS